MKNFTAKLVSSKRKSSSSTTGGSPSGGSTTPTQRPSNQLTPQQSGGSTTSLPAMQNQYPLGRPPSYTHSTAPGLAPQQQHGMPPRLSFCAECCVQVFLTLTR